MSDTVSKRVTLIVISINMVVNAFMMSAVTIALPTIGREFAMEAALLGWVVTAMTLPQAVVLLAVGRLSDIYGRKKFFLYGVLVFAVASFLCATADSAVLLMVYRVLQGIGGGMAFGTAIALLTSVFPAGERGRAIGIGTAAIFLGMSVGPFLGGVLTQYLGWRSIFFLNSLLCLLVVGLTFWRLKGEWAEARGERFDLVGSIVFGISLVMVLYGLTVVTTTLGIVLVLLGILGVVAFVRWEARSDSPILNISLFRRNKIFIFSNITILIHICAASAVIFILSLYLQYTKGLPPQTAGLVILVLPVCTTIFAPISGRLSDKVDPLVLASIGMAVSFVALVMFVFLTEDTALGFVMAGLAIFGIGVGIFSSPNANAVMSSVEKKFLGIASGAQGTMRSCGQVLGMSIVIVIFSIYIGKVEITPEYYPAFLMSAKTAFMIFAAIGLGGVFSQLVGLKVGRA